MPPAPCSDADCIALHIADELEVNCCKAIECPTSTAATAEALDSSASATPASSVTTSSSSPSSSWSSSSDSERALLHSQSASASATAHAAEHSSLCCSSTGLHAESRGTTTERVESKSHATALDCSSSDSEAGEPEVEPDSPRSGSRLVSHALVRPALHYHSHSHIAESAGPGRVWGGNAAVARGGEGRPFALPHQCDHDGQLVTVGLDPAAAPSPVLSRYPLPQEDGDYSSATALNPEPVWRVLDSTLAPEGLWRTLDAERANQRTGFAETESSSDSESDEDEHEQEGDEQQDHSGAVSVVVGSCAPSAPLPLPPLQPGQGRLLSRQQLDDFARTQASQVNRQQQKMARKRRRKARNNASWTPGSRSVYSPPRSLHFQHGLIAYTPPAAPVVVREECGICFESYPSNEMVNWGQQASVAVRPKCQHRYCAGCTKACLESEILDGRVMQIRCPGRAPDGGVCTAIAPTQFIKLQCGVELFAKYERFLTLKADQSFRSCPNAACMHVQQRAMGLSDRMQCEKCATEYCFLHDRAHSHEDGACSAYKKKQAVESAASLKHIDDECVKCPWPTCRVNVLKESGCNHMTCSQCRTHFCFLCSGLYLGGLHFAPFNIFGCRDLKNENLPANSRNTFLRNCFRWIFGTPLLIALAALVMGLALVVLAAYVAWVVLLIPLWIVWGVRVCRLNASGNRDAWQSGDRLKTWMGWGVMLVGVFLE